MRQSKKVTALLFLIFLVGLALVLYPSFSDYWNSMHQSREIASYAEITASISSEEYAEMWEAARAYNETLVENTGSYELTPEQEELYGTLLNPTGNGIMGYVEVPSVDIQLPVYHGTGEVELQRGAGHIVWTSLPVGGESTHSVLSSHRGLPAARLFTDLDKLMVGDVFLLQMLDQTLTYEVDQINIVLPENAESLFISPGKDYCTLVTCTPYGINTHRLLLRGHRIENAEGKTVRIVSEAIQIKPMVIAPLLALPMLLGLFVALMLEDTAGSKRAQRDDSRESLAP